MKRVTGVGGLFFKSARPEEMRTWYQTHLGIQDAFTWRDEKKPDKKCHTAWGIFPQTTEYFDPSGASFMFNFRVDNLDQLLAALKEEGVTIAGDVESLPYGRFAWILDPEGNKIELWEPVDESLDLPDEP